MGINELKLEAFRLLENNDFDGLAELIKNSKNKSIPNDLDCRKYNHNITNILINTMPVPIFFKDIEGKYINCNDSFCQFFNLDKSQIIGFKSEEIWNDSIIGNYYHQDNKIDDSEYGKLLVETKAVINDNKIIDVLLHKSYFFDPISLERKIVGIIFDLTERKILEENINESKETLRAMLDAIQETAMLIDKDGIVVTANQTCAERLNLNLEDLIGKPIYDFLEISKAEQYKYYITKTINDRIPYQFEDDNDSACIFNTVYPVFDKERNIANIAIIAVDMSKRKAIESDFQKEQALLVTLMNSVSDLIFMKDTDSKYINCNIAFQDYLGKPKDEIIGVDDTALYPLDEALIYLASDKSVFDLEKPIRSEQTLLFADGRKLIFDTLKTPYFDSNGNLRGLIGIGRDISEFKRMEEDIKNINQELEDIIDKRTIKLQQEIHERIRAEEALKKSREMYRNLFNDVSVGIYRTTMDGNILLANPALVNMLGYSSINDLKSRNLNSEGFADLDLRKKFIQDITNNDDITEFESVWLKKDGTPLFIREKAKIVKDYVGNILYIEGTAEDITERKHAEQLQQSVYKISELAYYVKSLEEYYPLLHKLINELLPAENFYVGIFDESNNEVVFPYIVDEIESPEPSKLGPYPFGKGLTEYVINCGASCLLTMKEIKELENKAEVVLSGPMPLCWLGVPLKTTENKTIGVLAIQSYNSKITYNKEAEEILGFVSTQIATVIYRKQIEEALAIERKYLAERVIERTEELSALNAELERAVRTKDEFLANMSHELRTPLNAILGLSEIMLKHKDISENDRHRRALNTIRESGSHLLNLINDILDLSKIEAGKLDINIEKISVEHICQNSLQFVRQQAIKKNIDINVEINDCPEEFWADAVRIKQILINLLNNAVKFTPSTGQVGLKVNSDYNHEVLYFTVWDTGIGISTENLNRLFKPFVQVSSSLAREYEGTGLGLSLVSKLTEMHGGSISVESEVGIGSKFTIALPVRNPSNKKEITLSDDERIAISSINHAFIIEDSNEDTEKLRYFLDKMSIKSTVHIFETNMMDSVIEAMPDVIFLDILLWDKSGWDILSTIKKHDVIGHIPVVVTTVLQERPRAIALGADGYLNKPYSYHSLYESLVKVQDKIYRQQKNELSNDMGAQLEMENLPLILLAEDNEANLETLETFLEFGGYRVVIARNGKEAVDCANEYQPNLILMDIQMPKMDGLEAIRLIKSNNKLNEIPIIALTALAMPGDKERCLSAGANEYVSKPVNFDTLMSSMEKLLGKN